EKGQKVSVLAEQVNQARLRADGLTTRLQQAEVDVASADRRLAVSSGALRQQAVDTYVRRTLTTVSANPSADGFTLAVQKTYASSMAATREEALDQVKATKGDFEDQRAKYATAKKAADGALKVVSASQKAAAKAVADDEKL